MVSDRLAICQRHSGIAGAGSLSGPVGPTPGRVGSAAVGVNRSFRLLGRQYFPMHANADVWPTILSAGVGRYCPRHRRRLQALPEDMRTLVEFPVYEVAAE